jgi:hypothetical protein
VTVGPRLSALVRAVGVREADGNGVARRRTGGLMAIGIRMCRSRRLLALACMAAALALVPNPAGAADGGYWLVGGDGGVFAFGVPFLGSNAGDPGACRPNTVDRTLPDGACQAIAAVPDGSGYWILDIDIGAITPAGAAGFFGQPFDEFQGVPREFVPTGRAIVSTPSGQGYWVLVVGLSGAATIMPFGDASFLGDTATLAASGLEVRGDPVGVAVTPDGQGYWEVHSDGGVFAFGTAPFHGSLGGVLLNERIVAIVATADGGGYWLIGADGGVFAFGNAPFAGSLGGTPLNSPIVGAARSSPAGYVLAARDGGVFAFGDAPFHGSLGSTALARPIFGITSPAP